MKRAAVFLALLVPTFLRADGLSLYWLENLAVQYEGTGYRQTPSGWELKVKPQGEGQGLRWRRGLFQFQFWRNNPYFSWEDGNSAGPVMRQTGQTRLGVNALQADVRLPLAGSTVEAVAGLAAASASFDRRDVKYNAVVVPTAARETVMGVGPAIGVHAGGEKPLGRFSLWADAEISTSHFLFTHNRIREDVGAIRRNGFGYLFRAEAGVKRGDWRLGLGVTRQAYEFLVPGGRGLSNGAAESLPINKIDFESPFLSLTWEGL